MRSLESESDDLDLPQASQSLGHCISPGTTESSPSSLVSQNY